VTTWIPGASNEFESTTFEKAWADPHLDHGIAYVGPGLHTIVIELIAESVNTYQSNDGVGFIRADEGVPEPASVLTVVSAIAALAAFRKRGRTARVS
jgi:hypothetical protein